MDLDQLQRLFTWGAILAFLIAGIAILGEVLGWWNEAGEVAITVATLAGVLLAAIALLLNATKGQVSAVAQGVSSNGEKLDTLHADMGTLHADMGTLHADMGTLHADNERQTEVLVEIRDRL